MREFKDFPEEVQEKIRAKRKELIDASIGTGAGIHKESYEVGYKDGAVETLNWIIKEE